VSTTDSRCGYNVPLAMYCNEADFDRNVVARRFSLNQADIDPRSIKFWFGQRYFPYYILALQRIEPDGRLVLQLEGVISLNQTKLKFRERLADSESASMLTQICSFSFFFFAGC
jgi:hypothetical protein